MNKDNKKVNSQDLTLDENLDNTKSTSKKQVGKTTRQKKNTEETSEVAKVRKKKKVKEISKDSVQDESEAILQDYQKFIKFTQTASGIDKIRLFPYLYVETSLGKQKNDLDYDYDLPLLRQGVYFRELASKYFLAASELDIMSDWSYQEKVNNFRNAKVYDEIFRIKSQNYSYGKTEFNENRNIYVEGEAVELDIQQASKILTAKEHIYHFIPLPPGINVLKNDTFEFSINNTDYVRYFSDFFSDDDYESKEFTFCFASINDAESRISSIENIPEKDKDLYRLHYSGNLQINENSFLFSENDIYQYAILARGVITDLSPETNKISFKIECYHTARIFDLIESKGIYYGVCLEVDPSINYTRELYDMISSISLTDLSEYFPFDNFAAITEIGEREGVYESELSHQEMWEVDVFLANISKLLKSKFLDELNDFAPLMREKYLNELVRIKNIDDLLIFIALVLKTGFLVKQVLIQCPLFDRFRLIFSLLGRKKFFKKIRDTISTNVQKEIDQHQKEYYLREQLKAIYKELGENESLEEEKDRYLELLKVSNISETNKEILLKEINKLPKYQQGVPEASTLRNYLDLVFDLPWGKIDEENMDISLARARLDKNHKYLDKVKERILEYLSVRKLQLLDNNNEQPTILCLAGPPGVGKTSIGQSIADAVGRKFVRMSLGGMRDEAEIRGHRRTYIGAMPGRLISAIRQAKTDNPLILLDEIDKIGSDYKGDPSSALLELLDPSQNSTFRDHYLELPYDFSKVLFVTTANDLRNIPEPLLDRLEVIPLESYTEQEKIGIARDYLWPKIIKSTSYKGELKISDDVIAHIIRQYTYEAGVRSLNRILQSILRKIVLREEEKKSVKTDLSIDLVDELINSEHTEPKKAREFNLPGNVNGLAWNNHGGSVLEVEAILTAGKGNIHITGNLGKVMKESVEVALGYIKSIAPKLDLPEDYLEKHDYYIHFLDGAIPKDGPSAGCAITLAIISAIKQIPVPADVGMTGEISLLGRVLGIGGLKEKTMAGKRYGLKKIYLPFENKSFIEQADPDVYEGLELVPIKHFSELLEKTLGIKL